MLLIRHNTDRCELLLLSVLLNDKLVVLDKFVLVLSEPPKRQQPQRASKCGWKSTAIMCASGARWSREDKRRRSAAQDRAFGAD